MSRREFSSLLLALTAALLLTAGNSLGAVEESPLLQYPQAKPIADFALTGEQGQPLSLEVFANRWTLVFFGFTHCPSICPTTLARLTQLQSRWPIDTPDAPTVLLLSVDPDRDSPARLREYLDSFSAAAGALAGATGDIRQIRALALQMGAQFGEHADQHAGGHGDGPAHTASVYLMGPDQRLHGVLRPDFDATVAARDVADYVTQQAAGSGGENQR